MTAILRRPVPRFCVWAAILIGVAAATAVAGLAWWLIALVELAAWAVVTLVERRLWRVSLAPPGVAAAPLPVELAAPVEPVESVTRVDRGSTVGAPRQREPAAAGAGRRLARQSKAPAPMPAIGAHVRWNVWSLEKLAREHPETEELEFMVVSLREFADADGHLPADFDPLVRESFGDLLPG